MNTDQYLQMLQMQGNGGGTPQQPQQQQGFNPLGSGASQAIESVRNSLAPKRPGFLGTIANMASNYGIAGLRGSINPHARAMGESMQTSEQRMSEEEKKNMEIMKFLQDAEEARERQQNQLDTLNETKRYHTLQAEDMRLRRGRESAQDKKAAREEAKLNEIEERTNNLQETEPGAFYLKDVPVSERNKYVDSQRKVLDKLGGQRGVVKEVDQLSKLVKDNPGVISSNFVTMATSKDGKISPAARLWMQKTAQGRKDVTVLDKFGKGINELKRAKIEGMSGVRPNIFIEKIISSSTGDQGLSDDALLDNFKNIREDAHGSVVLGERVRKDQSRRIYNANNVYGDPNRLESSDANASSRAAKSGVINIRDRESGETIQIPANADPKLIEEAMQLGEVVE